MGGFVMPEHSIYKDIAERTGGDIYVGVVGPVRSGKSTFIHRFLETVVVPNIENEYDRERTLDQMPQSASGRTVMTTEPKFVPDEAVKISPPTTVSSVAPSATASTSRTSPLPARTALRSPAAAALLVFPQEPATT